MITQELLRQGASVIQHLDSDFGESIKVHQLKDGTEKSLTIVFSKTCQLVKECYDLS